MSKKCNVFLLNCCGNPNLYACFIKLMVQLSNIPFPFGDLLWKLHPKAKDHCSSHTKHIYTLRFFFFHAPSHAFFNKSKIQHYHPSNTHTCNRNYRLINSLPIFNQHTLSWIGNTRYSFRNGLLLRLVETHILKH